MLLSSFFPRSGIVRARKGFHYLHWSYFSRGNSRSFFTRPLQRSNTGLRSWILGVFGSLGLWASLNVLNEGREKDDGYLFSEMNIHSYHDQEETETDVDTIEVVSVQQIATSAFEMDEEERVDEEPFTPMSIEERQENAHLIALADDLRENMELPQQSLFRSVAVLAYEDIKGVKRHIVGTTCEASCFLQNSISAERSALAQLANQGGFSRVIKIVIVTDSPYWVFPGASSREFLTSTCEPDTPVVICGSKDQNDYFVTSVGELYPYPNIYASLDRMECVLFGGHVAEAMERPTSNKTARVYEMAQLAAKRDVADDLHPLKLGAAVLFEDGTMEVAWQQKNAEYASSLDPVSLLAMALEKKRLEGIEAEMILQVDQFGVLHAPVPPARAFLASHGYHKATILVHDSNGQIHKVTPKQLLPQAEDILGFDPENYAQKEDA